MNSSSIEVWTMAVKVKAGSACLSVIRAKLALMMAIVFAGALFRAPAQDWPEVFNPFKVVTLNFEIDPALWEAIKQDTNYYDPALNIRVPCLMWAEGETNQLLVQIRRKADPALPSEADPQKVSLKIDINEYVTGQEWRGLKKLSLENGAGGNGVLREGVAMNLHRIAAEHGFYDYEAGYSTWVRVLVNSNYVGLFSSPEQRDKQFLRNRGMYKPGASWIYEINGGTSLDTTVAETNSPTYDFLCFSPFRTDCSQPSIPNVAIAMETNLPAWVDVPGMLTLAAIEAFISNTDGLFTKNGKNSFAVDFLPSTQHKRQYYPWDLDGGFSSTTWDIYAGGAGPASGRLYQTQILAHYWFRQQYRHTFSDLLDRPLSTATLTAFLNQLEPVLTPYLQEDPNSNIGGDAAGHFAQVREFFTNRTANVRTQIGALTGPPQFSQRGGEIINGFSLTLTHTNAAGNIYYTLDGSDPRGVGGVVMGSAHAGPLPLTNTTCISARVLTGTNWSALRRHTFNLAGHASALKVTEIMYHPLTPATNIDAGDYEFIELKNTGDRPLDLSDCYFEGLQFKFSPGAVVLPGAFVVLAKHPLAFAARYPGVTLHGVYFGGLSADGEEIRLRNSDGNTILSVTFNNKPPWPLGADGFGYSLVNRFPDGNPNDPDNWRASTTVNGSPGADDPAPPYAIGVVVNEVIAHTDTPLEDAIELFNPTTNAIDISGWFLSDNNNSVAQLKKYRFPAGTSIPALGYKTLYESDFNPANVNSQALIKFALSQFGENAYLASADANGDLTGQIVGLEFSASDNGVAWGRHQTSVGVDFTFLAQYTFGVTNPASKFEFRQGAGMTNAPPQIGPVIISEIMYHPKTGGYEFVELQNVVATNVNLSGWTLKGAAFTFPTNTVIAASNYLVLLGTTNVSLEQFRAANQVPASVPIIAHDFDLQNSGEAIELGKPSDPSSNPAIRVDYVRYNDKSPWPTEADGLGLSLERVDPRSYGNEPRNWRALQVGGTPGRAAVLTTVPVIVKNSAWNYHALSHNLGTAWRAAAYADGGWQNGIGILGYGQPTVTTFLTNAPEATSRPVTTYFRKEFVVCDDATLIANLILKANYDDGFVAYLNGNEIVRRAMPAGSISFDTLSEGHESGTYETIDLSSQIGQLLPGGNTLAVELHQATTNDADLVWDAELTYSLATTATLGRLRILPVFSQTGELLLEWDALPGQQYVIQESASLTSWSNLSPIITADAVIEQYSLTNSPAFLFRFYRVMLGP
jgi:hypothetical protein